MRLRRGGRGVYNFRWGAPPSARYVYLDREKFPKVWKIVVELVLALVRLVLAAVCVVLMLPFIAFSWIKPVRAVHLWIARNVLVRLIPPA